MLDVVVFVVADADAALPDGAGQVVRSSSSASSSATQRRLVALTDDHQWVVDRRMVGRTLCERQPKMFNAAANR